MRRLNKSRYIGRRSTCPKSALGRSRGQSDARLDVAPERAEIDGLGEQRLSAAFENCSSCFCVAVRRDHDHGNVGPCGPYLWQQVQAAHPRHVDIREDQNERLTGDGVDQLKRFGCRAREIHLEAAITNLAPELLAEQCLNVGFVIDHEDTRAHIFPPEPIDAALRGRMIRNSVKAPGSVSTSIAPPCCFATTSWLSDRPRPVPSPAGLVVKNGSNIFSFAPAGTPVALSRMQISTLSPRFFVEAESVG